MSVSESAFDIHDQAEHIEPLDQFEPVMTPDFEPNTVEMRFVADSFIRTLIGRRDEAISGDLRTPFPGALSVGVFGHRVVPSIVGRSSVVRPATTIDQVRDDVQSSIEVWCDCVRAVDNGGQWRRAIDGHPCRRMADHRPIAERRVRDRQLLIVDLEVFVSPKVQITLMATDCQ